MPIRVIAGKAKGRRLKLVPGDSTRPIMDRAKEALFSIIGQHIVDAVFLDVFAGTGSVGIEAISRGALEATFLDLNRNAIRTINDNLETVGFKDQSTVLMTDALAYLKKPPPKEFHFIYIAPPQYKDMWLEALRVLDANPDWVTLDTVVIVQIDPSELRDHGDVTFEHLNEYDRRKYGKTMLIFYENSALNDFDDEDGDEDFD